MIKLLILLMSFSAMAANDCAQEFVHFGSGNKMVPLTQACLDEVINSPVASLEVEDKKYFIGSNAIIITLNGTVSHLIAGEFTSLKNITALAVSIEHREIAVLERETFEIKIFSTDFTGNTSPLRVIKTDELVGITEISYEQDRVCGFNPIQQTSYAYSREANVLRREQYQKIDLVEQFDQVSEVKCFKN